MLKCIEFINEKNKRFKATFTNGTTTKFGQSNPKQGTFIDHKDMTLRKNYIKRHLRDLDTNDFTRAGFLSLFLLWDKPTLKESITSYNKRILKNDWDIKI
jgi:hypothetical protein